MRWSRQGLVLLFMLVATVAVRADEVAEISQQALLSRLGSATAPLVIDVRSAEEYAAGHVPGAINIPHTEISSALPRLAAQRQHDVVVYCASGRRAGLALAVLRGDGFSHLLHLTGDYNGWSQAGQRVEAAPPSPR